MSYDTLCVGLQHSAQKVPFLAVFYVVMRFCGLSSNWDSPWMLLWCFSFLPSAQEHGTQAKAEGGDKLAAVLKLESELQAVREQAAEHESELRQELQQARRDKQQAEAKLGGLDLAQMEVCCAAHGPTITCIQYNKFDCASFTCVSDPAEDDLDHEQMKTSHPTSQDRYAYAAPVGGFADGECRKCYRQVPRVPHTETAMLMVPPACECSRRESRKPM